MNVKFNTILIKKENSVFTVTLNRPELHNAFDETMLRELTYCFSKVIPEEKEIKVILLKAEGKSFCAGADLNWMKKVKDLSFEENINDANLLFELMNSIYKCPYPVIARVQGPAMGGGLGLISACDIVVASNNAKFSFSEVKIGLGPSVISSFAYLKIGGWANELFLTGEKFDSEKALKIGLINYSVPDEELDNKINHLIASIKEGSTNAHKEIKELIKRLPGKTPDEMRAYTTHLIAKMRQSKDGQEGISAFLEKRKPRWCE